MNYKIENYRNAISLQSDNLIMSVDILHPKLGWAPYGLNADDTDQTVCNDHLFALIADDFLPFVAPTKEEIEAMEAQQNEEEKQKIIMEKNAAIDLLTDGKDENTAAAIRAMFGYE